MKNVLLFVIFTLLFISCRKDENLIPVDTEAIRAQMVAAPALNKIEVKSILPAELKLKDGPVTTPITQAEELNLIQLFDLDPKMYVFTDKVAVKHFLYLEVDSYSNRKKEFTIHQIFEIKNGVIDASKYSLEYEIGSVYSREYFINVSAMVSQITYILHFDNGKQFSYNGNNGPRVQIAPIANCKWQILAYHWDGDLAQEFASDLIDYFSQSNTVNLRLEVKSSNVKSTVKMSKNLFIGAMSIVLEGKDTQGNQASINSRVAYDQSMPSKVSFDAPFDIKTVTIYYLNNNYAMFYTKDSKIIVYTADNKIIYEF